MKISSWLKIKGGILIILSVLNVLCMIRLQSSINEERATVARQAQLKQLGNDMIMSSDYMTQQIQRYVQLGDITYHQNYMKEFEENKTQDKIIEQLTKLGAPKNELELVLNAKDSALTLSETDQSAIQAVEAKDFEQARRLVFGEFYYESKSIINRYMDQFQQTMNERLSKETAAAKEAAQLMMNITVILLCVTFVVLFAIFVLVSRKIRPLRIVNEKLAELASNGGDLTARLTENTKDEVGEISGSLNRMLESMHKMIKDISAVSHNMLETSGKLSSNTTNSAAATEEVSRRMQEISQGASVSVQNTVDSSRAIEEMTTGVQRVAGSASELAASAMETERDAEEGFNHMEKAKQQMSQIDQTVHESVAIVTKLDERSSHIQNMADTIAELAKQTNLLSLNASIEAARAGEHGRGFAVVAGEIRKLAEGSAQSADHIAELLQEIRGGSAATVQAMSRITEEVELGSHKMSYASESFHKILSATKLVTGQIQEVSAITEEMAAGSEEIAASVADMASVAEQSLTGVRIINEKTDAQEELVREVSNLSTGLRHEAEQLEQLVRKFKI